MTAAGLIALALAGQAVGAEPVERCGGGEMDASGDLEVGWADGFDISQSGQPIPWPIELKQASFVVCRRTSLVLGPNDLSVLNDLGVPLGISDGVRMMWLYRQSEQVRIQMDEGMLTEEEARLNEQRLVAFNNAFPASD